VPGAHETPLAAPPLIARIGEDEWRVWREVRLVVAGLPRESAGERGLGAMWVAPLWRGRGVAAALTGAVIAWARSEGCARIGLWVPADSPRARRFYQRQGFRSTGRARTFPNDATRTIDEMALELGRPTPYRGRRG